tara:strand:+ start:151 stop:735 length:585 start_codon:yes stop_codon:yes gene_type:complete
MALGFNGGTNVITGLATGGLPDGSVDQDSLASSVNTIIYSDMWRLTSSFDDESDPISSNWERVDNNGEGVIGAVSAPSSGIWTLPATGIWHIHFHIQGAALNENNAWPSAYIYTTVDNGSNWLKTGIGHQATIDGSASWQYFQVDSHVFLDVADTSNVKFKLTTKNDGSSGNIRTAGNTEENQTFVQMIRLGGT